MGLALLKTGVSQSEVEVAWATYRALLLAAVDDPELEDDAAHQLAIVRARDTFARLYDDWSRRC
jgi:hypothetical protein